MPRDINGNYTPPAGNPVTAGTLIEAEWANALVNDIKTEMTNSLSRDGYGGMRTQFKNADGTMLAPGDSWINEPSSGWYRKGLNSFALSVGNEDIFTVNKTGLSMASGKTIVGALTTNDVKALILAAYPIGCIHLSMVSTNPSTYIGGTWALISGGRFLLGHNGGAYSAGGTGGEETVTLSAAQMPYHNHGGTTGADYPDHTHFTPGIGTNTLGGSSPYLNYVVYDGVNALYTSGATSRHYHDFTTDYRGGNAPHNNMPPYLVCYMWQRTA
jgi:hypothetical protein